MSLLYQAERIAGDAEADELEKIALSLRPIGNVLSKQFATRGAMAGRAATTALGAGLGAGIGAAVDKEDRSRGAILGALGGGALGLAGGQFATRAGQTQAKHFAQRQLHGATGYLPGKGFAATHTMQPEERVTALKAMGWEIPKAHAKDTGKAVENLKQQLAGERKKGEGLLGSLPERLGKTRAGQAWDRSKLRELLLRNRVAQDRANRALIEQGLTSIPGTVRGYALGARKPGELTRLQQVKANLVAPGLAFGVGLPAASLIGSGMDVAETGDVKQLGRDVVDTAGYAAFAGLPILPAMAVGQGLSSGAGLLLGKDKRQSKDATNELARRIVSGGAG